MPISTQRSSRINVKIHLCLIKYHAMKMYWGSGGTTPRIHNLCTRCGWVVSFTPRLFTDGEEPAIPTGYEAGWDLDPIWTKQNSCPYRDSNLNHTAHSSNNGLRKTTNPPFPFIMSEPVIWNM